MGESIRERINELKKMNGFETDSEVINAIFQFKKTRGQAGRSKDFEYNEKNKGSFSQCFNGKRNFKPEDYLAIEYVLNTSMAYIIEGKGEVSKDFKPSGIRYAAFTDTQGNYEELMREDIVNSSDEYNKTLIDYMIEYESKNGFKYFAERDLLPLGKTGGYSHKVNCLSCDSNDRKKLLQVLCKVLPINLLIKYFDGFLDHNDIIFSNIDVNQNTSFTDEVIGEVIKREDFRNALINTKIINLDAYNKGVIRKNGESFGDGLFVNYFLTAMIKYALNHDIDDDIRSELINDALRINEESFKFVSSFAEEELIIDKYGFITNKFTSVYFGSVVIPSEVNVEISDCSNALLKQLNRQVHDYHEFISNHSKISVYENEILADKVNNEDYYRFFKLMNDKEIDFIPLYDKKQSNDKDLFIVKNGEKSRISNGTDRDLYEILAVIKMIDDICLKELDGKTYYLVDPSIYMFDGQVNYLMPKDVVVSNKYSNLVRFINDNAMWSLCEYRNIMKIKRFISLLKVYGIRKEEIEDFLNDFVVLSGEQVKAVDRTTERGKELAFKTLENRDWITIYHDSIVKEF